MRVLCLIATVLATVPRVAPAQIPHTIGRYNVLQWGTRQGLPTNVTTGVARDPEGFLWISTYSGLARFDGVRFERFDPGTTPALPSTVTFLYTDVNGEPLIQSGTSLVRVQDDSLVEWKKWSGKVRAIRRGVAGALLVELSGSTALVYRGDDGASYVYRDADVGGQSRDGRVWLLEGTRIRCMDGERETARHTVTPDLLPNLITPWGDDGVLLHMDHQVAFVSPDTVRVFDVTQSVAPDLRRLQNDSRWTPHRILEDAHGGFWVATDSGLFHCDTFPLSPGSPFDAGARRVLPFKLTGGVDDVYPDGHGSLWVASRTGGLFRLTESLARPPEADSRWEQFFPDVGWGLHSRWLWRVADATSIWLRDLRGSFSTKVSSADRVTAEEDSSGGLWICWGSHATKYQHGRAVRRLPLPMAVPPRQMLTEDDGGGLMWAERGKIWRLHDGKATPLADHGREIIRRTPDGAVWFVTDAGLHRYKNGVVQDFPQTASRDPYFYRDVWTSPGGDVWVATRGSGLAVLTDGKCRFANFDEGVPDNTVGGILPDDHGRLWINSNRGVFVVPVTALDDFARGKADWLPCRLVTHVEAGSMIVAKGTDGRLYFDTMSGIVAIDPSRLPPAPAPPSARIVDLRAGGRRVARADAVRLPKGVRSLLIRYTAPDLDDGREVRFRHRLGRDAPWTEVARTREVLFSALRPGTREFDVQAAGVSGNWSPHGDAVVITVPPYFYETAWFKATLWIVAAGVLFLLYRLRSRVRERQLAAVQAEVVRRRAAERSLRRMGQRLISAQEHERTRIARELHDDVSQRLALLSVELDMVRPESLDRVPELADYCRGISSDIRNMSHSLHPAKLEQLGLAKSLESLCREIGATTSIDVSFRTEGSTDSVSPEVALCAYRIAQQALANVTRHSGSEWASVELAAGATQISLTVSDGGKGFERAGADDVGLGLTSMSERAMGLGGSFEIDSSPGNGTVIHATLPLTGTA